MIFSTYSFIFLFLPIVLIGYFLLHRVGLHKVAKCFLVVSSFIFYAIGSPSFVLIFMLSVTLNYCFGTVLSKLYKIKGGGNRDALFIFVVGILLNIALLGYYKYTDFFITNFNFFFGKNYELKNIVLPIGISFFTFQLIAYLVDSYRGLTLGYNFLDYLLFITFFPQLIVGPIVHHGEVVPQFEDRENWKMNWNNISKGLFIFTIGVAKKILLADMLTKNAQMFFVDHLQPCSAIFAWWYSIEYTVSYYFDLSSYADMAIGIALMFNIKIPENFNSPYKARNFQDYWQRWHITLSRFLGAYVFRSVYRKGSAARNYYVATMITFLVSGFWHGAGYNFILWGLVNGVLVCTASYMKRKGISFNSVLAHALTLVGIVLTRIMFVCDFKQMIIVFKSLFNFTSFAAPAGIVVSPFFWTLRIIQMICAIIIIFFMPTTHEIAQKFSPGFKYFVPTMLMAGLSVALMGEANVFLYFQF